jgi:hypothetical protein
LQPDRHYQVSGGFTADCAIGRRHLPRLKNAPCAPAPRFRSREREVIQRVGGKTIMSKKPKVDHEYHDRKDKMKITIKGYSPNKKTRKAIIKKVNDALKKSKPDRLVEYDDKLTQVGD